MAYDFLYFLTLLFSRYDVAAATDVTLPPPLISPPPCHYVIHIDTLMIFTPMPPLPPLR